MTQVSAARYNTEFLFSPDILLPVEEAIQLLDYSTVNFICKRPANMQEFPDLATRLRGALGRSLYVQSQDWYAHHDAFNRLSPYDFLFGDHGNFEPHASLPKPYAVKSLIQADTLSVKIILIGHAQYYAPFVQEAMANALTEGIKLSETGKFHVSLKISQGWIEACSGITVANGTYANLNFDTPLCIRSGKNLSLGTKAFLSSLMLRSRGLLRWCGIDLEKSTDQSNLLRGISINTADMRPVRWHRHSIRQKGVSIPMEGFLGSMVMQGDLMPLSPFLHIGEVFGVGSHVALGMGHYRLSMFAG